jgi:hypothetical protein
VELGIGPPCAATYYAGVAATGTWNDGQWHLVHAVFDRSNNAIYAYVDGVLRSSTPMPGAAGVDINCVCNWSLNSNRTAEIELGSTAVFGTALNATEVAIRWASR